MTTQTVSRLEDVQGLFPRTLAEAVRLMSGVAVAPRVLAGGTDLMAQWQSGVPLPEQALSVLQLPELQGVRMAAGRVIIGAAVTHAELRRADLVVRHLPALAAAAATVGGAQIQARGTIAGNVANASPAGDLPPALLVTGGRVVLAGPAGERAVALADFFLGYRKTALQPGELIVRFELPVLPAGQCEFFHKVGTRAAQAISKVMAAARFAVQDGHIRTAAVAVGSVAPTAIRLPELEAWLVGRPLNAETLARAEQMTQNTVKPISDIRSTAEYRAWVAGRLVRGFLEKIPAA